jgi:hypothetical protein
VPGRLGPGQREGRFDRGVGKVRQLGAHGGHHRDRFGGAQVSGRDAQQRPAVGESEIVGGARPGEGGDRLRVRPDGPQQFGPQVGGGARGGLGA